MIFLAVYASFLAFLAVSVTLFVTLGPERARQPLGWAILAAAGLTLVLSAVTTGIMFDAITYLGDLWTAFEAINKASHGLRSSLDYFSPIGPLHDWLYVLATHLRTPSAATVPLAGALTGLLASLLALAMLSRHVSLLGLAITIFLAVATAVSPREIDVIFPDLSLDYLAPYNRWAWALFIPVAVRLGVPGSRRDLLGGAALGVAIAGLLLLKITYGAAAIGLLLLSAVLRVERMGSALIALTVMLATLAVAQVLTGQILPYVEDLAFAARMESNSLRLLELVRQSGEMGLAYLAGLIVLFLTIGDPVPSRGWIARAGIMILAVGGAGCAVLMQNHYETEAALYAVLPLIAAEWTNFLRSAAPPERTNWGDRAIVPAGRSGLHDGALLLAIMLFALKPALIDAGSLADQQFELIQKGADPALKDTPLQDLRTHPSQTGEDGGSCVTSTCRDYARMLSGLDMLKAAGAQEEGAGTVLALNFSNPFPMLLDRPSPSATPIWLHKGRSFSAATHIPPEDLFAGVDYVMISTNDPNARELERIYSDYLEKFYELTEEDRHWKLLTARGSEN